MKLLSRTNQEEYDRITIEDRKGKVKLKMGDINDKRNCIYEEKICAPHG